jgi:hypothetical protein
MPESIPVLNPVTFKVFRWVQIYDSNRKQYSQKYGLPVDFDVLFSERMHFEYTGCINITFVGGDTTIPHLFRTEDYRKEWNNQTLNLIVFKDYYWMYQGAVFKNRTFTYRTYCQNDARTFPTIYVGRYYEVICLHSSWSVNYCHWTHDILAFLLEIPSEIRNRSHFVTGPIQHFAEETLDYLGMANRTVILGRKDYIFADFAYSWEPFPCAEQNPVILVRYRKFLTDNFGLDKEAPTKHFFLNRELNRKIGNFNELISAAKQEFPKEPWELIRPFTSVITAAKEFNKARFFMTPHGSACINAIYMQPRTVLCEIQSSISYGFFMNVTRIFGEFNVICRIPTMSHWKPKVYDLPLEKGMAVIRAAMYHLTTPPTEVWRVYGKPEYR